MIFGIISIEVFAPLALPQRPLAMTRCFRAYNDIEMNLQNAREENMTYRGTAKPNRAFENGHSQAALRALARAVQRGR